jgi:glycosyltransferase involved in cell wall biosynthesis
MIRVAALTSGKNVPSARLRVRQHIEPLKRAGIHVQEFVPAIDKYAPPPPSLPLSNRPVSLSVRAIWKAAKVLARVPGTMGTWVADITWLERELHPGMLTLEPFLKHPLVLDVDDAIWLTPPYGRSTAVRIAKIADVVLAGNGHIADWFSAWARNVRVVPTAVDTDRIKPRHSCEPKACHGPFVIGWTGTSSNYPSLYRVEKGLAEFLNDHDAELVIVSDRAPRFSMIGTERVRYVTWDPEKEIEILGQLDVGLMPLIPDEWSLGKCSFKMLQYMAAGLPVVVSPVGMNRDVLAMGNIGLPAVEPGDWYEALRRLYRDRALAIALGVGGREIVERHFSRGVVSGMLAGIFRGFS